MEPMAYVHVPSPPSSRRASAAVTLAPGTSLCQAERVLSAVLYVEHVIIPGSTLTRVQGSGGDLVCCFGDTLDDGDDVWPPRRGSAVWLGTAPASTAQATQEIVVKVVQSSSRELAALQAFHANHRVSDGCVIWSLCTFIRPVHCLTRGLWCGGVGSGGRRLRRHPCPSRRARLHVCERSVVVSSGHAMLPSADSLVEHPRTAHTPRLRSCGVCNCPSGAGEVRRGHLALFVASFASSPGCKVCVWSGRFCRLSTCGM
jgi:hypothetical protein